MFRLTVFFAVFALVEAVYSHDLHLADSHGPISLMGDHTHKKGEVMFSYRFSKMEMNKLMNGTKQLSTNQAMTSPNGASNEKGSYMNSPIHMKMDMHMLGAMYAPSDYLTLMVMGSFMSKEMTQKRMPMVGNTNFDVNSAGIGDIRFSGLVNLFDGKFTKSHIGIGMSFPTGSIDKRDNTPASSNARLGYSMQNGSGTFDPYIFLNNVNSYGRFKIGEQFFIKSPATGKNSKNYKYGTTYDASLWTSYRWIKNISTAVKLNYNFQEKMKGQDNEMNPRMSPAMDSRNKGHQKLNLGVSVNLVNHLKFLKNNRLGIEGIFPLYSRCRGIQMKDDYKIIIGWQYGF